MAGHQEQGQQQEQVFTMSTADLIKDASRLREFRGNNDYALSSFLREVNTILTLFNTNPAAKLYVYQQGQALDVVRTLGVNSTWEQIKAALISNFGVKETYHQLYQQAFSARNTNVRDFFFTLRKILDKLNEKYEYDHAKPQEFSPLCNEAIILRTFLSNLEPNLATVILNKNIQNLREAFNYLENANLLRNNRDNRENRYKPNNFQNRRNNDKRHDGYQRQNQYTQQNNYRPPSGHFRPNYQNRPNNNLRPPSHQTRRNYSTPSGRNRGPNYNNRPEPMEVDHVNTGNNTEEAANFQLTPPRRFYP